MSGGVDSSIAAALMLERGHDVVGMTMALYDASSSPRKGRGGTCCSPAEIDLARQACERLGIPHYTVDERSRFTEAVLDDFVREYAAGRTPNPCARCNQHVKFTPLLERAAALGAERLVTGHYARVLDGALCRGIDQGKDQSYFLFAMGKAALARVDFPLGSWSKDRVREKARDLGLPNAATPDSQELCFVPGGDHGEVVEARARALGIDPEVLAPGEIRDGSGRVLGHHRGIHRVTVGQRRGLGIASEKPLYVLRVLPEERAVVVGDVPGLERGEVWLRDFCRMAALPENGELRAEVQIRHRSPPSPARIRIDGESAHVAFEAPVRAVSPGQAAVLYDGDRVLGGGWMSVGDPEA
jgi:tRNA-specific 2-thiouridylase